MLPDKTLFLLLDYYNNHKINHTAQYVECLVTYVTHIFLRGVYDYF